MANGDFTRSANQGKFLLYSMAKLREEVSDVPGLVNWIASFKRNAATNLKPSELLILAQIARSIDPANIQNVVLSGKAGKVGTGKTAEDVVNLDPSYQGLFVDVGRDGGERRQVVRGSGVRRSDPPDAAAHRADEGAGGLSRSSGTGARPRSSAWSHPRTRRSLRR